MLVWREIVVVQDGISGCPFPSYQQPILSSLLEFVWRLARKARVPGKCQQGIVRVISKELTYSSAGVGRSSGVFAIHF